MKRRNFLASLFALPFAAKPLEAAIRRVTINEDVDLPYIEVRIFGDFDQHRAAIEGNREYITRLSEALLRNAPTGLKKTEYRYTDEDVRRLTRGKK